MGAIEGLLEIGDLVRVGDMFAIVQAIDYINNFAWGNWYDGSDGANEARQNAQGKGLNWGCADINHEMSIYKTLSPSRPAEKICTCTTLDLFRAGCGCGAITPYKQVY